LFTTVFFGCLTLGSAVWGEVATCLMIGSLCEAVERDELRLFVRLSYHNTAP
jgi:hypothetical protein